MRFEIVKSGVVWGFDGDFRFQLGLTVESADVRRPGSGLREQWQKTMFVPIAVGQHNLRKLKRIVQGKDTPGRHGKTVASDVRGSRLPGVGWLLEQRGVESD